MPHDRLTPVTTKILYVGLSVRLACSVAGRTNSPTYSGYFPISCTRGNTPIINENQNADCADFRRLNPCESVLSLRQAQDTAMSIRVLFSEQATRPAGTGNDENRNADFADDADFRRLNPFDRLRTAPCESVLSLRQAQDTAVSIRVLFFRAERGLSRKCGKSRIFLASIRGNQPFPCHPRSTSCLSHSLLVYSLPYVK